MDEDFVAIFLILCLEHVFERLLLSVNFKAELINILHDQALENRYEQGSVENEPFVVSTDAAPHVESDSGESDDDPDKSNGSLGTPRDDQGPSNIDRTTPNPDKTSDSRGTPRDDPEQRDTEHTSPSQNKKILPLTWIYGGVSSSNFPKRNQGIPASLQWAFGKLSCQQIF